MDETELKSVYGLKRVASLANILWTKTMFPENKTDQPSPPAVQ